MAGLRQECYEKRSDVYAVASAEQAEATLAAAAGPGSKDKGWCHPNGVVVSTPPKRSAVGIWTWTDAEGVATVARDAPKLLLRVKSLSELRPHTLFHWVGKKSRRFSDVQTKPKDVGGYVCGGAKKTDDEVRFVVEGDVELAVVLHDNALARHRAEDDGVAVGGDVPLGGDATTLAELQAELQERDVALQEKEAENAQLKAEIDALRMQPRGAVVDLHVVAADASAAGVDPSSKLWFFTDHDDPDIVHGPFPLEKYHEWHAWEHFVIDQPIHLGDGSPTIELKVAFQEAAWWYVTDVDGSGSVSGPYALKLLKEWQTEGRVEGGQELRMGESGESTTLIAALHAVGLGMERVEASGGGGGRRTMLKNNFLVGIKIKINLTTSKFIARGT